jgi:hypothetical protein
MSKKQINKKKVSIKLVPGETAVVLGYDTFMHIAQTYDYLASQEEQSEHRDVYYEIADAIRYQSADNYFENGIGDDEYEW